MTGWTGVTTLQRKRRCHLQESKSGITEALSPIGNQAAGGRRLEDQPMEHKHGRAGYEETNGADYPQDCNANNGSHGQ